MKTPPATILIKKAAGIQKGSKPHTDKVGKITKAQCEEIAKTKMKDLTAGRPRRRRSHHRWFRPQHGHHRGGPVIMAKLSKREKALQGKVDRNKNYPLDRSPAWSRSRHRQVRRVDRRRREPRRRCAQVRPAGSRFVSCCRPVPARRFRVAVFAQGDKAEAAKAAGADVVGFDDLAERSRPATSISMSYRDPGRHARRRCPGSDPRSPRPDAEPEGWHRDHGRHHRREERQGRSGSVPYRQGWQA